MTAPIHMMMMKDPWSILYLIGFHYTCACRNDICAWNWQLRSPSKLKSGISQNLQSHPPPPTALSSPSDWYRCQPATSSPEPSEPHVVIVRVHFTSSLSQCQSSFVVFVSRSFWWHSMWATYDSTETKREEETKRMKEGSIVVEHPRPKWTCLQATTSLKAWKNKTFALSSFYCFVVIFIAMRGGLSDRCHVSEKQWIITTKVI